MNVGMYSMALTNRPDADDYGMTCTLTFGKEISDGVQKVICDTMTLASPIEGIPGGKWD